MHYANEGKILLRYSLKAKSALQTIYTLNFSCFRQTLRKFLHFLAVLKYLQKSTFAQNRTHLCIKRACISRNQN